MSFSENYDIIEEKDGRFTAVDPATNVSSYGNTKKEAVENLQEALEGYYSSQSNDSDFYLGMRKSGFMAMIMILFTICMAVIISSMVLFIRFG